MFVDVCRSSRVAHEELHVTNSNSIPYLLRFNLTRTCIVAQTSLANIISPCLTVELKTGLLKTGIHWTLLPTTFSCPKICDFTRTDSSDPCFSVASLDYFARNLCFPSSVSASSRISLQFAPTFSPPSSRFPM